MGMDVFGRDGSYFRRSIWGWRPLAEYIEDQFPEIARHCQYWHTNDGDGLDGVHSRALAEGMHEAVASGAAALYVQERNQRLSALPLETCRLCTGTGIRRDRVGQEMGQPDQMITKENHPRHGQHGWCNGCDGVGRVPSFETYYPLELEDIREFVDFLWTCDGFSIC